MFGSTSGGKAGTSGTSDQTGEVLQREKGLKKAQIKEPQALIPKMMPRQGSHPPIEARQVYRIPEIVSPYFLVYKWCHC